MIDRILLNFVNVWCYVDEVVVFSKNTKEHAVHHENVFSILKDNWLRFQSMKFSFIQSSVKLLGHIFDKNGLCFDDWKVEKVRDAILPNTSMELRPFIRLASYYRRFVLGFVTITRTFNGKSQTNSSLSGPNKCRSLSRIESKVRIGTFFGIPGLRKTIRRVHWCL